MITSKNISSKVTDQLSDPLLLLFRMIMNKYHDLSLVERNVTRSVIIYASDAEKTYYEYFSDEDNGTSSSSSP